MFSLLVALTMYLTFTPARPGLSADAFVRPKPQASLPLAANATRPPQGPSKKDPNRLGLETTARAHVVIDWKTGSTLSEKNADQPMAIASITKLLTALVVLDGKPDWNKVVDVQPGDEPPGGIPYLIPGEKVTVGDLFNLSLVASSNGATIELARSTGLSSDDFAKKMNEKAKEIGMGDSGFTEPTGLDAHDAASARDVAELIRAALDRKEIRETVAKREYRFTAKTGLAHYVRSTDELLGSFLEGSPYRFLGGKTGHIDEAGYCFGAAAQDANGNGVVAVVLGTGSKDLRFQETKSLIYWTFDAYQWPSKQTALR